MENQRITKHGVIVKMVSMVSGFSLAMPLSD
jgi:hypothetical protein